MNKYEKWYNAIIERAKNRTLEGYSEKHHIIPKSLGGSDKSFNLIKLTAREHFICHLLLLKFKRGKDKYSMLCAFARFGVNGKFNSRLYEEKKIRLSEQNSLRNKGEGNANYGGKYTSRPEVRAKMRQPRVNKENMGKHVRTEEIIAKYKESRAKGTAGKGEYNSMAKEENRKKVSESKIGRKRYYNEDRSKFKYCFPGTEPEGWSQ